MNYSHTIYLDTNELDLQCAKSVEEAVLSLFNIQIVLMILLAIMFMWLSQFKWIFMVMPKKLKSFIHSMFIPSICNTGDYIFF